MQTELDNCYEVLLTSLYYDGNNLIAEVKEQFVDGRGNIEINSSSRKFNVLFSFVKSYLIIEEFAESIAGLVRNDEKEFLRKMENKLLTEFLGLNVEEIYGNLICYALLTSHEILIVYCEDNPIVERINKDY